VPVELRRASAADVPALLELWRVAEAAPTHTDTAEALEQLLAHDPAALLLAVDADNGGVVGSVIAAWDGWRGSIYRLVVAPRHRRRGRGRRLLSAAEARLADAGAVRSQAVVVETDAQAAAFWTASGWQRQSERLRFTHG
jgi:ribosomal protein S18 acetylase RimI-like enzyme